MGLMIENQTTKLKGSRLTAWQARGLSTANWNALRPGLVCMCVCLLVHVDSARAFVLSKGPQYLRMRPPSVLLARLPPRVQSYLPFSL